MKTESQEDKWIYPISSQNRLFVSNLVTVGGYSSAGRHVGLALGLCDMVIFSVINNIKLVARCQHLTMIHCQLKNLLVK